MSGDEYARVFDENPMKRLKKQKEPIKETGLSGVKYEKFKNVGILTIEHFIVG